MMESSATHPVADVGEHPPLFDTVDINGGDDDDDGINNIRGGRGGGGIGICDDDANDDDDDNEIFESAVQQINQQTIPHHHLHQQPQQQQSSPPQTPQQHQQQLLQQMPAVMEEVLTIGSGGNNSNSSISNICIGRNGSGGGGDYIEITVSEPHKSGDGMSSYILYKVTTKTSLPKFNKTHSCTMRRFSDFLGLHALLVGKYLRYGRIIPPAPSKNLIGTTKVKMASGGGNGQSAADSNGGHAYGSANGGGMEWMENRRAALERFIGRIAQHPELRVDADVINFLQSDEELPKAVGTSTLSGAGVMRLFNKVGETVNKITYKMDENDAWFEEKVNEVENLDMHLQRLHTAIKALVVHRRELSALTGTVAKSAAMLSTCEEHAGLSRALSQLADVEEKVELLRSEQANSDLYILSETLKDYVGLFGAIKDVFHERVKVFQNWQHAQLQLTKRREANEKFKAANRSDKLEQAQREVEEWEAKVQRCQQEFDEISVVIKAEIERFELNRVRDFKATIIKYLQDQMAHQQQLIKYWETFIPIAAKEID